ncbi:restriction endonuclease subunit S [Streptococcus cristatus]|uniref:EcoKI restriction-modification system protein HsdS n=3 Tax=Streptococcus TaxID=1301 RepID=A0A3R9LKF4_STRCR|nr:restriction endonuclease subunit S [Streptococcus cristatus]RSJ75796.1 EcoKI restriction-modification system protein HsdS [Streptococcus cristatus]
MSEWKRYKLGELLRVKHGWAFKGEFFSDTGVQSILTPGNFYEYGGFKANPSKDRFYSGDYPKEYLCSKGDLVVAMTEQAAGLLGSTAIVPEDNRYLHNQRIGLISCNGSLNKDFAYYLFMTQSVRQQISRSASGTKVKHTSPEKIYDVQVDIPKIQTQKNIAIFLSLLDKKIQINNQINQELEAMAKTLYDYWFVQFDFPDQNGKPYKSSGGKMVYNPELKREIPEGWGVDSLWNIANFYNGLAMQKYRPDTNEDDYLPVIKIREMMNGFTKDTEKARLDIPTEAVVESGDILFSWSATLEIVIWGKERGALNQHIFKVTSDTYPKSFIYFELKSYLKVFKSIAELRKTTMGHITQDHLKQAKIVVPQIEIISKLDAKLQPIMLKQQILENQNQELTQLRDWLLPMLMNGQVKVGNYTD